MGFELEPLLNEGKSLLSDQTVTQRPQSEARIRANSWLLACVDFCHRQYGADSPLTKDAEKAKNMAFAHTFRKGDPPRDEGPEIAKRLEGMMTVLHAAERAASHRESIGVF